MPLPCIHMKEVTDQLGPTIDLLEHMDTVHPDLLIEHGIRPPDYHGSLVFRSAIESIRGNYIASAPTIRQAIMADVLASMKKSGAIVDFKLMAGRERYDFTVVLSEDPDKFAAVEVKGGEGNSINISERPRWAREFLVWSHLDGAIVNQPAHGAHAIVMTRLSAEMVLRRKQVDALFIKDRLCGTPTRPCPKYPGKETSIGLYGAPCVFLFPRAIPKWDGTRSPDVHDISTISLPFLILDAYGVRRENYEDHLYQVKITLFEGTAGARRRRTQAFYKGELRDEGVGRGR